MIFQRWNFCLHEMEPFWRKIRIGWLSVRVRVAIYTEIIRRDSGFYAASSPVFPLLSC